MQQPIKDLQYFKDEVAKRANYIDWKQFISQCNNKNIICDMYDRAAERYTVKREQQAKEAAWEEGYKAHQNHSTNGGHPGYNAPMNPYREKGGEDE